MANVIRIKRSASTNVPTPTLAQGELANSESGSPNGINELYIGISGAAQFKLIRNLNGAAAEPTAGLAAATPVTGDYMVFEDVTDSQGKRVLFSATPLSIFNNDQSWNNYSHPNHSGDVTSVGDGTQTIAADAVTYAKMQNVVANNVFLGNNSGAGAIVDELTGTEATAMLNLFVTTSTVKGLVPGSNNLGATYFLNGAGAWAIPAGAGSVTSVSAGDGMDFTTITDTGPVTMGTPGSATATSTNAVTATSHTHAIDSTIARIASPTFTGTVTLPATNMADSILDQPVLRDFGVTHQVATVSTNAVTVNLELGNSCLIDMDPATAAVTLTLSNPPVSGTYGEVALHIVMGTPAYGMTWPGSITWQGGSAPTLSTINNTVDIVHLYTIDGGTNWYGTFAIAASAGSGTLASLTDTNITSPADAGLLLYDTGTSTWRDATMSGDASIGDTGVITVSNSAALGGTAAASYALIADAVMEADTATTGWGFVLDEDAMGSDSDTKLATQQSIKAYVDNAVTGALTHKGSYNASTNTPALDTGTPTLEVGDMYTVTVAGTFFTVELEVGDVLISDVDSTDAASVDDWTIVQNNIGAASETAAGYIEIATTAEANGGSDDARAITSLKLHATTFDGGTF